MIEATIPPRNPDRLVALGLDADELPGDDLELTSYAFVSLADFHAFSGAPGWSEKYEAHTITALDRLATESHISTWYRASKRDMLMTAMRIGTGEWLLNEAKARGVDLGPTH